MFQILFRKSICIQILFESILNKSAYYVYVNKGGLVQVVIHHTCKYVMEYIDVISLTAPLHGKRRDLRGQSSKSRGATPGKFLYFCIQSHSLLLLSDLQRGSKRESFRLLLQSSRVPLNGIKGSQKPRRTKAPTLANLHFKCKFKRA